MRSLMLLSIIGLVVASPIDSNNLEETLSNTPEIRSSLIEGQLIGLLEDLRQTMVTGSDTIPVLDPLTVDFLGIDENVVPLPGLRAEIGDTRITKLSSFVVDELTVARTTLLPLRYRVTLDLQIPVIEIDAGHYDLSVPVQGLVIFGNGDAKISVIEPRVTGHVLARAVLGFFSLFIRLEECSLTLSLKAFEPQINGLLGGSESLGAFINTFLSYFIPDLVKLYEDDISQVLSSTVLDLGNELLADLNLIGIIGSV